MLNSRRETCRPGFGEIVRRAQCAHQVNFIADIESNIKCSAGVRRSRDIVDIGRREPDTQAPEPVKTMVGLVVQAADSRAKNGAVR